MTKQIVKQLAYHRNGIAGAGFYVAIMEETEDNTTRNMVVIRFPGIDEKIGAIACAAFDIAKLAEENIGFAEGNSWRGDHYVETMDKAINLRALDVIKRKRQ